MSSIRSRVSSCRWKASTVGKKSNSGPGLKEGECLVIKAIYLKEAPHRTGLHTKLTIKETRSICSHYLRGSLPGVRAPRLPVEPCRSGFFGTQNFPTCGPGHSNVSLIRIKLRFTTGSKLSEIPSLVRKTMSPGSTSVILKGREIAIAYNTFHISTCT